MTYSVIHTIDLEIFQSSAVCGFFVLFSTNIGALQIPRITVLNLFSRSVKNTCEGIHF